MRVQLKNSLPGALRLADLIRATQQLVCIAALFTFPPIAFGEATVALELSDQSVLVLRDVDQPSAFYMVPVSYAISSQSDGRPNIGIQYYKPEGGGKHAVEASVTLSIASTLDRNRINALAAKLRDRFPSINPRLSAPPNVRVRLSAYRVDLLAAPLAQTPWTTAPADGSQAIAFKVAAQSHSELSGMLHAKGSGLAVLVEIEVSGIVDGVASGQIKGKTVADIAKRRGIVEQGLNFTQFLKEVVDGALDVLPQDRAYVVQSARDWLQQRMGPPSLLRKGTSLAYGWNVSESALSTAQDQSLRVLIGTPHTLRTAGILELGDTCSLYPRSILSLDEGVQGCDALD